MILYRRGLGLFDQQELAQYFKIKVAKDQQACFNIRLGIYTKTNYDEGLKTIESEDIINRFFKSRKISLTAKAVRASEIEDITSFLFENIRKDNDLWIEYKSHKIHGEKYIHDNVIESIQKTKTSAKVILVDPAPRHKPRIIVGVRELEEAVSDKYGRETGFIVVSSAKVSLK